MPLAARWTAIQHVSFEAPGLIASVAGERAIELEVCRMDLGDPLPRVEEIGGLVVMGGPMGAFDDAEHPYLADERSLLEHAARAGLPVLGVCLGAQLLAAGLGGRVMRGPELEIGFGSVQLVADDHVLGVCGSELPVMHWHQDTFELPGDATPLASSERYQQQAFCFGTHAYGLQFHIELDGTLADALRPHLPADVDLPEPQRAAVEAAGRAVLGRLFDRWLS